MDPIRNCIACSAGLQSGARFCASCGQPVETGTSEGERRTLTVLFCDLVDSTGLSARLDPEDLHDLYTSYGRICQDVIRSHRGYVAQFLGDGVLCYFGYPVAHEDDPVRAVRAGLQIIEELRLVNQGIGNRLHAELHVRIGIHTGPARIGGVTPGGSHDRLAVGETVNLAARTEALADVDSVFITAAAAKLVEGHFELQAQRPQIFRGLTRTMDLFRVAQPTGARNRFEAAARGWLTPYVGREEQLAEFVSSWNEVRAGGDRVIVVRGEAGIGKSRLLDHFRRVALEDGAQVLECFCSPLTEATPLAPVVEFLNTRVAERARGSVAPGARFEALCSLLGEHSGFGSDALALIANLLSISGADESAISDLSPARQRLRTLEILRAWLAVSAERLPLMLLVEDAHWADPSTLEFLDLIVRESPGGRTLLCVTGRPEFHDRWSGPSMRTIDLARLNANDTESMVQHLAHGHSLPAVVVRGIGERSEGVPLFVEEVTKAVLESGAVRLEGGAYTLVGSFGESFIPATVEGSLVARFDRLGKSRGIAQLGAAIGREFGYSLLREVAPMSEADLRADLSQLSASELVYARGEPPSSTYIFKHALIQEAIYGTLLKAESARVHGRIFSAIQDKFPELIAERPETAAYHAERAGRKDAAVPLLLEAGARALARTAVAEAVKHLAHGIDLVGVLEEPARTAVEIELQAAIGPAYMATVGWAAREVETSSLRLRELAAAKGDGARVYQADWSFWTALFLRGDLKRGLEVARQVFEMAQAVGDPVLRVTGYHALGYTNFYRGEYQQALQHAHAGLELFDLDRERWITTNFQLSSSCALLCFLSQTQQVLGFVDQAMETFQRWQVLVDDLRHAPSRAFSLVQQCHFCFAKGDVAMVRELATEGRLLSLAEGFALWFPINEMFLAWSRARQGGNATLEVENFRRAKALVDGTGTHITELDFTSMYVELLLLANQPEKVFDVAEAALAITRPGAVVHMEPELLRLQGDAALALGDRRRAIASYKASLASAQATGAVVLERRAASALERCAEDPRASGRIQPLSLDQ